MIFVIDPFPTLLAGWALPDLPDIQQVALVPQLKTSGWQSCRAIGNELPYFKLSAPSTWVRSPLTEQIHPPEHMDKYDSSPRDPKQGERGEIGKFNKIRPVF